MLVELPGWPRSGGDLLIQAAGIESASGQRVPYAPREQVSQLVCAGPRIHVWYV